MDEGGPRPKKKKKEVGIWIVATMFGASEEDVTVQGGGFTGSTLSE